MIRQMDSLELIGDNSQSFEGFPVEEFWKKYDAGEFANQIPPSKPITDFKSPAFQKWMKDVQALPAVKQIEAVVKKLVELNPGFDGNVTGGLPNTTPKIENDVVVEFGLDADSVSDISPIRCLKGLKMLDCHGSPKKGKLIDLSPLQGLPLEYLSIYFNDVEDISALKGMPLSNLFAAGTKITELAPIKGMPLKRLQIEDTKVSDLSPLEGMPLVALFLSSTRVTDLSTIKNLPLEYLKIENLPLTDLSAVKAMPLKSLFMSITSITDLSPLRGKNLVDIRFTPKNIKIGIDVLREMQSLKMIYIPDIIGANQGSYSPEEFWKRYDAGEFNNPAQ